MPTYCYTIRTSPETDAIFQLDEIAHTDARDVPSELPPFLKLEQDEDDDLSTCSSVDVTTTMSSAHFIPLVCDSEEETMRKSCYFTGCTYITPHEVLLTDWSNGVLVLLNVHGVVCDTLKLEQSPWEITRVDDGRAAVTVPKLQQIVFVETEPNLIVVSSFYTQGECFGICKVKDMYAITCDACSKAPSVQLYTENGNLAWTVQTDDLGYSFFKCPLHLCSDYFQYVLYVTDSGANSVHTLSLTGELLQCFKKPRLDYPTGILCDRHNYIYVCSKRSSTILRLSPNRGDCESVLSDADSLHSPCAMCAHPDGDHVLVTDLHSQNCSGFWKLQTS